MTPAEQLAILLQRRWPPQPANPPDDMTEAPTIPSAAPRRSGVTKEPGRDG